MAKAEAKGGTKKSALGLRIIAVGKAVKVLTLLVAGTAACATVGHDAPHELLHVANGLGVAPGNHLLQKLTGELAGIGPKQLIEVALGCFAYAALFAVEGYGLWTRKTWGEYFTIGITVSFIPLELYEIARHPNAPKLVMLALNVAALGYLVWRVMSERRRSGHGQLGIASH